jgi:membrane-bound lytic murein transglycosylase MltF
VRLPNFTITDLMPSVALFGGLVISLAIGFGLYAYHQELTTPTLASIKRQGVLHVATLNSPTTYYEDRHGPTGFEYELANLFAQELGVRLVIQQADNVSDLLSDLNRHRVDLAAAGLTVTPTYQKHFTFSDPYRDVKQQIIYHRDNDKPKNINDLTGTLSVLASSSEAATLSALQKKHASLLWSELTDKDTIDLLTELANKKIDYTIVNSNEFMVNSVAFPELAPAFNLGDALPIAWALPQKADPALLTAINDFFKKIKADGRLDELEERFYGHIDQINYVGAEQLFKDSRKRLPHYINMIKEAATKNNIDWALLAALGYQESHWTPDATSPTGVRGFMMLTKDTAAHLGVTDQLNAKQSIDGGARYLVEIKDSFSEKITEPDRTWLALAAYNVGIGHLQDAQKIAKQLGKDPYKWVDVKETLPLLQKPQWFSKVRHGYARGYEPVLFVQNIRRYMDIITWATDIRRNSIWNDELTENAVPEKALNAL